MLLTCRVQFMLDQALHVIALGSSIALPPPSLAGDDGPLRALRSHGLDAK